MSASTFGCRPFLSADDMDTALLAAWEAAVRPGDEVWVLGDLTLRQVSRALVLVSALPGHKFLVPGNHDRCWAGHRKGIEKWHMEYEAAGLEVVDGPVKAALAGTGAGVCSATSPTRAARARWAGTCRTDRPTRGPGSSTATFMSTGAR